MSEGMIMSPISDKFYTNNIPNSNEPEDTQAPYWQEVESLNTFKFRRREFFVNKIEISGFIGFAITDAKTGCAVKVVYNASNVILVDWAIEDFKRDHAKTDFEAATVGKAISPRYTSGTMLEIKSL